MAERAEEYLSKGMEVFVEGRLTHRNYTDKEGIKRFYTEVDAQELVLMNVRKPTPAEA
jgi:single-strand DNA-binding protein